MKRSWRRVRDDWLSACEWIIYHAFILIYRLRFCWREGVFHALHYEGLAWGEIIAWDCPLIDNTRSCRRENEDDGRALFSRFRDLCTFISACNRLSASSSTQRGGSGRISSSCAYIYMPHAGYNTRNTRDQNSSGTRRRHTSSRIRYHEKEKFVAHLCEKHSGRHTTALRFMVWACRRRHALCLFRYCEEFTFSIIERNWLDNIYAFHNAFIYRLFPDLSGLPWSWSARPCRHYVDDACQP